MGVGSKECETQATVQACKEISALRMDDKVNGKLVTDNPDVLFGKFMERTSTCELFVFCRLGACDRFRADRSITTTYRYHHFRFPA